MNFTFPPCTEMQNIFYRHKYVSKFISIAIKLSNFETKKKAVKIIVMEETSFDSGLFIRQVT
jgi:hypothetical protein